MSNLSSQSSNNVSSLLVEEKKGFDKFFAELKDSVFQVLYLILKEEETAFLRMIIEVGLDYLQLAAFAFDDTVIDLWKAEDFL